MEELRCRLSELGLTLPFFRGAKLIPEWGAIEITWSVTRAPVRYSSLTIRSTVIA